MSEERTKKHALTSSKTHYKKTKITEDTPIVDFTFTSTEGIINSLFFSFFL